MPAFFISAAIGAVQVFLLKNTLANITSGKKKKALLFLVLKFLIYAVSIATIVIDYSKYLLYCAFGFIAGMPFFAILMFIYTSYVKKER